MERDSKQTFADYLSFRLGYYMGKGLFEHYPVSYNSHIKELAEELYNRAVELYQEREEEANKNN